MGGSPSRAAGTRLGPYTLVRPLGAGASGEVWEACLHGPAGFRKTVALKLLKAHPRDPGPLQREARLGALLQHPNVVGTLGLGRYGGVWCVALELVHGLSVAQLCRAAGTRLPPGVVLDVGIQAAAGLHHVHALVVDGALAGLVHRDVKPANLLVDRSGLVKVADLGISVASGETAVPAGTPGYVAPEQLQGRPEARSDLFSLGMTLFVLATGLRPVRSASSSGAVPWFDAMVTPALLDPVDAAVPGLGAVVGRCLRESPADRPVSARAVGDALAALRPRQSPGPSLLDLLARAAPDLGLPSTWTSEVATRILQAGNTTPSRDAFVGRAEELATLVELVRSSRWVVVHGPGGAGKTRVALEMAARVRNHFAGGTWAFDLTEARTAEGVCGAVAAALGLELERHDPAGQLGRVFADKGRALVVLDNLEQCVDVLPATVGRWLERAPDAAFVGTTRVVPGLKAERTLVLGELSLADSVALLRTRAPRALSDAEEEEARALCRALDGMPLAIELAAARLRVLDLAAVRSRLALSLLSGGRREVPARQRSVAASLEWSWELLSAGARGALVQLSVFEGGFELAAAEAQLDPAAPGGAWALDLLQELCEASLVRTDFRSGRFSLLAVVREFAAGKLTGAHRSAAEARHGAFYAQLGSPEAVDLLHGRQGTERFASCALEIDNLVAACRRAVARGDGAVAVATFVAAGAIFGRQGPLGTWVGLGEEVRRMGTLTQEERARAHHWSGVALRLVGRRDEARVELHAALACYPVGERGPRANVHRSLGNVAVGTGRKDEARSHFLEALRLAEEIGDRRSQGATLNALGTLGHDQGYAADSLSCYEAALAVSREVADRRTEGSVLGNLGVLHLEQGRVEQARACGEEALRADREVGDRRAEGLVSCNLALLHMEHGQGDDAHRCFQEARRVSAMVGNRGFEGVVLGGLANLLMAEGKLDLARDAFEAALRLQAELGDRRARGIVLGNFGNLYLWQGRCDEARALFDEALALNTAVGNRRSYGVVLGSIANLHRDEGRIDEAVATYEEALRIHREVGNRRSETVVLQCLASVLWDAGRTDDARGHYDSALAVALAVGSPTLECLVLADLARVRAADGDVAEALRLVERAEQLASGWEGPRLALCLASRAEVCARVGDRDGALQAIARAEAMVPARYTLIERGLRRARAVLAGP